MSPERPPLHFRDVGEGTPIVLVHGDFANGEIAWASQLSSLADSVRLIVPDRRGHGASPIDPHPYTIASDVADCLDVADRAGVEQFHLVGHSYGGLVALDVARRSPRRVLSLHLVEPPYLGLLPDDLDVRRLNDDAGDLWRQAQTLGPEETTAAFFGLLAGPIGLARLRQNAAWPTLVAEGQRFGGSEFPGDYPTDWLRTWHPDWPVVIYTGGRSHSALRRIAKHLADTIPGARLVDVPEAFHDVQRARESFNRALLQTIGDSNS